jgi:hypothetical protein
MQPHRDSCETFLAATTSSLITLLSLLLLYSTDKVNN